MLSVPIRSLPFLFVPIRSSSFFAVPIRSYFKRSFPNPFLIGRVGGGGGGSLCVGVILVLFF